MNPPLDYFVDKKDIEKYSNPTIVQKKARENGFLIVFSPRKNKKYVMVNPDTNNYVHFGEMGYEDATLHKDPIRISRFRQRNKKWENAPKYTPAWLSFHLLW